MDSKLIDLFREKVNNNGADLILHRYCNNNGKNQWSIICSAMDWISVVVGEIDVRKLSKKNNNLWSHQYVYKYKSPEIGKRLYQEYTAGVIKTEQDFQERLEECDNGR